MPKTRKLFVAICIIILLASIPACAYSTALKTNQQIIDHADLIIHTTPTPRPTQNP